ncbi:hypothetical protein [Streptomyces rishiriensis]|uniref:Uncharacterized protein n=1 Tax=Streptomyces rishiriensis TaxID=68264 RepID=A0ABU0NIB1_STRRH|nr:hypothetical protein [Streptomyces rishiriensis]MDQ0578305.1 hypothetical protein [Streptomyces rishiriensis]
MAFFENTTGMTAVVRGQQKVQTPQDLRCLNRRRGACGPLPLRLA